MTETRMDGRMEARVDALLRRLDVPSSPDDGFVSASIAELLPQARRARAQDRSRAGRLLRDLRLAAANLTSRTATRSRYAIAGVSLLALIAVLLALLVIVVGSQRRLPPPFGFAANGQIAYAADGHVYLADPLGGNRRQLTFEGGQQADPTFSRDGTRLSWRQFNTGAEPDTADVVLADADGSRRVVIATSVQGLSHIAWSPDSRFVAFSGSIAGSPGSGWIAPADGSAPPAAFTSIAGAWDPTWSPDGQRLVIGADPGRLYVVDRDGSNPRRLTKTDFEEVGQRGEIAEWNPAGTLVLFTAFLPGGGENQVYLVGLDGQPERKLSNGTQTARDASWSPDGSEIAYMRTGSGTGPWLLITDVTGAHFRTLRGNYAWYQPIWSPDGTRIVVTDDRPGPNDEPGPAVRVILDAVGSAPPVEIPAAGVTPDLVPDWAASWQRLAP
jgi:Tol biopolymer transport system component